MACDIAIKIKSKMDAAEAALNSSSTPDDLESIRIDILGRNGFFSEISSELKNVPREDKPEAGKAFNEARNRFTELFSAAGKRIESLRKGTEKKLRPDLTLPGRKHRVGKKHPISRVIDDCVGIFRRLGFIVADGPEIETVYNNFDALNTPDEHPSRDPQDTFYFNDGRLLRTQTSPVQIRVMQKQDPPVRIVAPGRCFRRDTPDATHSLNFHQIEGLYVDRDVSMADLKSTLLFFARELIGSKADVRFRPHFFPFTEPSVEYDFSCIMCGGKGCRICKYSGWLEISGAGMVNPAVLRNVGYDPEIWSGYAFGMGIERIAMIRYAINDIRLLYENSSRFLSQF